MVRIRPPDRAPGVLVFSSGSVSDGCGALGKSMPFSEPQFPIQKHNSSL